MNFARLEAKRIAGAARDEFRRIRSDSPSDIRYIGFSVLQTQRALPGGENTFANRLACLRLAIREMASKSSNKGQ
jgi:hypothetical protein